MGDELDLTGDGGVLKAIVRKAKTDAIGPTEELPLVDVHYKVSFLETGEVIYDTLEDRFISFEIGKDDVIKGLDIALSTMKAGEIAKITSQPKYAYGSADSSSEIPPNSTVIFMAELMACRPQGSASPSSSSDDDIPSVEKLKEFYLIAARTEEQAKKFVEQKKEKREDQEEGVVYDLTSNGGVTKEIMKKAEANAIGPTEDLPVVDVHYEVSLAETGEVIYDTREDEIFSFEIDNNGVTIDGLPIALSTMKVGEIAKITCKPEYAYGSAGSSSDVPPNATLIFMVELMACRPRGSASPGSSSDDDIPSVEKMKELYLIAARTAEQPKKFVEQKKEKREDQVEGFAYDLTGDGGVTKEIMKKAEADAVGPAEHLQLADVKCHDCVVVTGTGDTLHYGYEDSPVLNFEIGRCIVIRGWDIALETMKVGEIAKITCKPEYAFGKKDTLPDIPPDATLICTLELMSCKDRSMRGSPSDEEARLEWEREVDSELKNWMELDAGQVAEQLGKVAMGPAFAAQVRARLDAKKNQRKGKKRKAEFPLPYEC